MGPRRALVEFKKLKTKHEKGKLKREAFEKQVALLRASSKGTEWKVDVEGNWYKKVDQEWLKDNIDFNTELSPQTLWQLLVMVIKGFVTYLPKRIAFLGFITGVAFVFHTYLVIYPNGGYWPGTNATLDRVLALTTNQGRAVALWTIGSYLLITLFRRVRHLGIKKIVSGCVKAPKRVVQSFTNKQGHVMKFFLILTSILLVLSDQVIKNEAIAYTLIIGAVMGLVVYKSDLSYLVLRLGYQDFARFFKLKNKGFKDIYFDGYQVAVVGAMLLYVVLPKKALFIYGTVFVLILLIFYKQLMQLKNKSKVVSFFALLTFNVGVMALFKVYADDGGVEEAGGFIEWITSPGAFTAVTIGMPPAIGAGLGGLIAIVTDGVGFVDAFVEDELEGFVDLVDDAIDQGSALADDAAEALEEAVTEGAALVEDATEVVEDAILEGSEMIDDAVESVEDALEAGSDLLDDALEAGVEAFDTLADSFEDADDVMEDLYDLVYGSPADKADALADLAEIAWEVPGELGDLISDGSDYVLTSGLADALFDSFDNLVPDWVVKGLEDSAGEAWDMMGAVKDLADMAGWIPEDSPIGGIMDKAGMLKDALENFGMGDNMVYAGIKSYLSNKFKGAIFDKNPALVLMDSLTTLLVGGSEAGEIISPGKTIQGSANFIIDKLTDLYNGTDDAGGRLDNGKYGGVLKVTDETTELIADAVYNPNEFAKDFEDVMTSDDFYDGMYETNKNLWKPKEGSWFIKRAGCYAGEKTCEGLIKIADGVHIFSSWLGSKFGG